MDHQRIFLSYARKDGADLALRLQKNLTVEGFDVWLDTQRLHGGESWTVEIENAIDRAHVILAVLTQGSYKSPICRAEQLRSLRKGKAVLPLLAQTDADRPLHLEAANYRDFSAVGDYEQQLRLLLTDIAAGEGAVPLRPEFHSTHVTAPPLPRKFLKRPEELASLRDAVLADDPGPSVALTALRGMGGIGKTVLAQALCHDQAVRDAFPDGIAWTTVGREPAYDLVTRMQEVRRALGDEPAANESELHCINRYRTLLREKAALLVVDDVWRSQDIEPFLAESPRSKILFTTRDGEIANATGARAHLAELLSVPQSRALLARWAQCDAGALPPNADAVVNECGLLPLALSMVGAMLRGKPAAHWDHVLKLLRQADLEKIRAQFPGYPHADMLRAIQVSVDALDGVARKRYRALAVLLEDMTIAPAVQQALWRVDEGEALETAERFIALSLAERDGEGVRLHDLQLDYVRAQFPDREALGLIHGAARLSSHVVERDPSQFASHMVGRLLPHREVMAIQQFIDGVTVGAPRPWLRPLRAALHPPDTPLLHTLGGHSGSVHGVAVTPDGKRVVSASDDHTLKIWDLESGRALRTLLGHTNSVYGVAVTPDGKNAVSASWDNTLKVWDLDTGRALCTLEGHSSSVWSVAVTPEGKRAVSASNDKTLRVWDLQSGCALRTLEGHSSGVTGVAVTPNGKLAVSASGDNTLKVWELESGRILHTLESGSPYARGVAVTPDGKRVLSASGDSRIVVWDLETGHAVRTLVGHSAPVDGVTVTPDGQWAISASSDITLRVWDLGSGLTLRTLEGHTGYVGGVAVTPDGRRVVSSSYDNTLRVWDLAGGRRLYIPEGHSYYVSGVAVAPDGELAVSGSHDKTLKVWSLASGRVLRTLEGHSHYIADVAVTADGQRAVSASWDKTVRVWDLESGRALHTLEGHSEHVYGVAVTPDGQCAVSASRDTTLKVWDLESGRALRTLEGHSSYVAGVAVTPDGRRVVSASHDSSLKVWSLDGGRALSTLKGHLSNVYRVAVTPDGRHAVSCSHDMTLKLWDLESGCALRTLEGHSAPVYDVAVTRDGKWAVSASFDKTLRMWDLESGLPIVTFCCDGFALSCAFIDQKCIIGGDFGGNLYILSLEESATLRSETNPTV